MNLKKLLCFEANPPFEVEVQYSVEFLNFKVMGDLKELSLPAPSLRPRALENLWQQTCFEVFLAKKNSDDYYEYNFSPSSDFMLYHFQSYRHGRKIIELKNPPSIETRLGARELFVEIHYPLPEVGLDLIGPTCILETRAQKKLHFAHQHGEKPDYHLKKFFLDSRF